MAEVCVGCMMLPASDVDMLKEERSVRAEKQRIMAAVLVHVLTTTQI